MGHDHIPPICGAPADGARLLAAAGLWDDRGGPEDGRRTPDESNAPVRERLHRLAAERRRFGYRRLGILLEREGIRMNKKLFRIIARRVCPSVAAAAASGRRARERRWRCRKVRTSAGAWIPSPTR